MVRVHSSPVVRMVQAMANNKENLEKWLLIDALLESDKADRIKGIAKKMIKELEEKREIEDN